MPASTNLYCERPHKIKIFISTHKKEVKKQNCREGIQGLRKAEEARHALDEIIKKRGICWGPF